MPVRQLRKKLPDGISRGEFYTRVNNIMDEVDPLLDDAYRFVQIATQGDVEQGEDAELPWHYSFHGSSFPGDDPLACGRYQLYRLMALPRQLVSRRGMQFMNQGKDAERRHVYNLWRAGLLVSAPPFRGIPQTQFQDDNSMLTSTVDSILLPLHSTQPFVGEFKLIFADHVWQLIKLIREIHPQYMRQTRCQIGMARDAGSQVRWRCFNSGRLAIQFPLEYDQKTGAVTKLGEWVCPEHGRGKCLQEVELKPVNHGYLFYMARDDSSIVRSYMFEHNEVFMEAGRRKLAQWREEYLAGTLPATNFDGKTRSHPFGWTWTRSQKMPDSPCEWCDFGQTCRDDHRKAVAQGGKILLEESSGIEQATIQMPDYDYESIRSDVLAFWGLQDRRRDGMIPPSTENSQKEAA